MSLGKRSAASENEEATLLEEKAKRLRISDQVNEIPAACAAPSTPGREDDVVQSKAAMGETLDYQQINSMLRQLHNERLQRHRY
mmetsp:Transcript_2519/g.4512  ORF Transcript_2519/g.4512 Transcript_2519/m.4512 type:complete len:84 (+) Transcript_2519:424-675(+)